MNLAKCTRGRELVYCLGLLAFATLTSAFSLAQTPGQPVVQTQSHYGRKPAERLEGDGQFSSVNGQK